MGWGSTLADEPPQRLDLVNKNVQILIFILLIEYLILTHSFVIIIQSSSDISLAFPWLQNKNNKTIQKTLDIIISQFKICSTKIGMRLWEKIVYNYAC